MATLTRQRQKVGGKKKEGPQVSKIKKLFTEEDLSL